MWKPKIYSQKKRKEIISYNFNPESLLVEQTGGIFEILFHHWVIN